MEMFHTKALTAFKKPVPVTGQWKEISLWSNCMWLCRGYCNRKGRLIYWMLSWNGWSASSSGIKTQLVKPTKLHWLTELRVGVSAFSPTNLKLKALALSFLPLNSFNILLYGAAKLRPRSGGTENCVGVWWQFILIHMCMLAETPWHLSALA